MEKIYINFFAELNKNVAILVRNCEILLQQKNLPLGRPKT